MPSNRLPRRILYGELVNGQRLPGGPKLHGPHSSYPEQVQYLYCRTGTAFNRPRHVEKCLCHAVAWQHTMRLQIKQLRIYVPAGTIHPTHQLLVQGSRICASEFGLHSHLRSHVSRPHQQHSKVIVELDGLLQASKLLCKHSFIHCSKTH